MDRMKCYVLIVFVLIIITGACTSTLALTPVQTKAVSESQPSEFTPSVQTPTNSCGTHTASTLLEASAESLKVGDTVKVKVILINEGCVALGMPQYILQIRSENQEPIFTPNNPEPVEHSLAVDPGQSDTTEFELKAIASGQATLTVEVSFEVHLGYPGPAYWGEADAEEPLIITVSP